MLEYLIPDLITLALLTLLQAVLGFDNLLYISLESKRAPVESRKSVRTWGIGIAIGLRIVLLFTLVNLIRLFEEPFWIVGDGAAAHGAEAGHAADAVVDASHAGETVATAAATSAEWFSVSMNVHALIVLIGGAFIIYTATKEVLHMMRVEDHHDGESKQRSAFSVMMWIVIMNVVFSFDSILSAMALAQREVVNDAGVTEKVYIMPVMIAAIVISGMLMIWMADRVSTFLERNRMYEVLGLFILFVVGIMLLTEGGHLAHLTFFGNAIVPMSKTTFYFVIAVLVLTDIVQTRYQKKLLAMRAQPEVHA